MTKPELLRKILSRVGDPQAKSSEWKDMAWDLFIESVYEAEPSLTMIESKFMTNRVIVSEAVDANGCITYDMDWSAYSNVGEITIHTDRGNIISQEIDYPSFCTMLANPYLRPQQMGGSYESLFYHSYDGSNLVILTPFPSGKEITFEIRYYPDIRDLLKNWDDVSDIPLHNSLLTRLIPQVAVKLKTEIGLIL